MYAWESPNRITRGLAFGLPHVHVAAHLAPSAVLGKVARPASLSLGVRLAGIVRIDVD